MQADYKQDRIWKLLTKNLTELTKIWKQTNQNDQTELTKITKQTGIFFNLTKLTVKPKTSVKFLKPN